MPYFDLKRNSSGGGEAIAPHASTHHAGGTDAITPEAIGARPVGVDIEWGEIVSPSDFPPEPHSHPIGDLTGFNLASQAFSFGAGWEPYHPEYPDSYRKQGNLVCLAGLVKRITTSGIVIAVLPVGYRPPARRLFSATIFSDLTTGYRLARVDIYTTGQISLVNPSVNTAIDWISLDGICFFIA